MTMRKLLKKLLPIGYPKWDPIIVRIPYPRWGDEDAVEHFIKKTATFIINKESMEIPFKSGKWFITGLDSRWGDLCLHGFEDIDIFGPAKPPPGVI